MHDYASTKVDRRGATAQKFRAAYYIFDMCTKQDTCRQSRVLSNRTAFQTGPRTSHTSGRIHTTDTNTDLTQCYPCSCTASVAVRPNRPPQARSDDTNAHLEPTALLHRPSTAEPYTGRDGLLEPLMNSSGRAHQPRSAAAVCRSRIRPVKEISDCSMISSLTGVSGGFLCRTRDTRVASISSSSA